MLNRVKHLLALLTAAIVLALAVGSSSASHIAVSSNTFRSTYESLAFEETSSLTVSCPVTLEGSYHSRTIAKVSGALVALILRADVAEASCRGGRVRADTENLPWHIRYATFSGTLPRITELNLDFAGTPFTVEVTGSGVACTYEAIPPLTLIRIGFLIAPWLPNPWPYIQRGWRWLRNNTPRFRRSSGSSILCPAEMGLEGEGSTTVAGSTALISVTLVL